jgi:GNAT superfamily N-acetyltransferase
MDESSSPSESPASSRPSESPRSSRPSDPSGQTPDTGSTDDPVVRRYEPGDQPAVRDVFERAMRDAGTDPADIPGTRDLEWIDAAYVETGGEFLVVEVGDEVVAIGGLVVDGDVAELFRIAVDPAHQREGHGSRLLAALEDAARGRGAERVVLTTASRQDSAVSFYRRHGYEGTGTDRDGEYRLRHFAKRLE